MTYAAKSLRKGVRRVLWWQAGVAVLVGVVGAVSRPQDAAARFLAALAGAAVAMIGTAILGRTVERTGPGQAAQAQLWLYGGAAARFLVAIVLLIVGLWVLRLPPLPFLLAFGVAQIAFLAPGVSLGL